MASAYAASNGVNDGSLGEVRAGGNDDVSVVGILPINH